MRIFTFGTGNRCAVHFPSLRLPISDEEALEILEKRGYRRVHVDLVALARNRVGKARYRRGARACEAPDVFDCSSFTKWVYAQMGCWLPRYSIQQREMTHEVKPEQAKAGDLAFSAGLHTWYWDDPSDGVGHIGFVTDDQTVIHAANSDEGIIEEPLSEWRSWSGFRGVRRLVPENQVLVTLEIPPHVDIESSDDLRWKILQHLPR